MATNPYARHYDQAQEQRLTDDLIIEAIQMKGIDVRYLPRTHNNFDAMLGEDSTSSFMSCTEIEMYPAEVNGFNGDGELMSRFGLEIKNTATFIVSRSRFSDEFPEFIRPREGDLIFMPYVNAVLEVKYVNADSPFFQQGKQFVWEVKVETYEFSHESFETSDTEIDDLLNGLVPTPATNTGSYGDNDEIESTYEPITSFDPNNPFGVSE